MEEIFVLIKYLYFLNAIDQILGYYLDKPIFLFFKNVWFVFN